MGWLPKVISEQEGDAIPDGTTNRQDHRIFSGLTGNSCPMVMPPPLSAPFVSTSNEFLPWGSSLRQLCAHLFQPVTLIRYGLAQAAFGPSLLIATVGQYSRLNL